MSAMLGTENPYASPRDATLRPLDEDRPLINSYSATITGIVPKN